MNKPANEGRQRLVKIVAYGIFSSFFAFVMVAILYIFAFTSETYAPFLWENRRFNVASNYFVPSEKFGWTLQPNIRISLVTDSGSYTDSDYFTSNSDGFRDTPKINDGLNQILVLGDSFVQGYYLSNRETIPYRLAQKLHKNVINTGVGGYSTENEYSVMKEFLKIENPQAIVLLFFANDLPFTSDNNLIDSQMKKREEQQNKNIKSTYRSDKKIITEAEIHKEIKICCSHVSYEKVIALNIRNKFKKYLKLLISPSLLIDSIREDFKYIFPSSSQYGYQLDLNSSVKFYEKPDLLEAGFNKSFEIIGKMKELAKSQDIKFYIFFVPEIAQMFDTHTERDTLNRYFSKKCKFYELNCVDPTDEFRKNPTAYYIMDDGHFSPAGANLMADLIAKRIKNDLPN